VLIGGALGYKLLVRLGARAAAEEVCSGRAFEGRSKLEVFFGAELWQAVAGKTIIDFGCGDGTEAIELARRGAARVIGVDIRPRLLAAARRAAAAAGVAERCVFTTEVREPADVIFSIDGFEHYADPAGVLTSMQSLLKPGGRVYNAFGPPWFHPLGGHLFTVIPWGHLIFTERALIRWRSDFKTDGATRFHEVEGGLNGMTVGRFERLVRASGFAVEAFDTVPIRRLRAIATWLTREFTTSVVRCRLAVAGPRSG